VYNTVVRLQNNPQENNVEPVPAKSELPPKNLPENNVEPVPAKSELSFGINFF
jgi:hypothetical protein